MQHRSLVGLSLLGSLCWSGAGAAAPTLTLDPTADRAVVLRAEARGRYRVSQADCQADDAFTFLVTPTESLGMGLQVWAGPAGVDCTGETERTGTAARCWRVAEGVAGDAPLGLDVRVQDILAGHRLGAGYGGPGAGDAAACTPEDEADHAARLHFLLVDGAGALPAGYQAPVFDTGWDLLGPGAPAEVTVTPGDATLTVEFTPSTSQDTWEHGVFAVSALALDPCVAEGAIPGTLPGTLEPALLLDTPVARAELGGIANGSAQAILVAGFDELENPGPLSVVACGTPVETTDFFEAYRAAGGQGGGGCGLAPRGPRSQGVAALAAALALVTRVGARSRARPGRRR